MLVIGSCGSQLALWQAHWVRDRLQALGQDCRVRGGMIQRLHRVEARPGGRLTPPLSARYHAVMRGCLLAALFALAPWLAGFLGERFGAHLPFWVGAAAVLGAAGVLGLTSRHLTGIDIEEDELEQITEQATAVTVGNDS